MMRAIHLGEVLREEFLSPLGISASELARCMSVPPNRVTGLLREERGVTAETALRLARALGTTPELWMSLQAVYDPSIARIESGKAIAKEVTQVKR